MVKIFSTKANTLTFLKPKVKKSIIENLHVFTVNDWRNRKKIILNQIQKKFTSPLIIRSSAIGEDSFESSNAGNFESIQNVSPKSRNHLSKAIEKVIFSYSKKGNENLQNQILVQNQTQKIDSSGVIFTRANENGSPYFIINYEEGGSTIGVTQGQINNILKIHRNYSPKNIPRKWNVLLNSIKEIEHISNSTSLDIEFGMKKTGKPIIFQVRPLTFVKNNNFKPLESKLSKLISKNKTNFIKYSKKPNDHFGKYTIFSDMADWNPSEIIGSNPNILDYSLYEFLIMDGSWHRGREILGYNRIRNYNLMKKFGNKPYVDIRASFNSLIPDEIDKKTKKKLANYYLSLLKTRPELHDKVEFEILFTCYDFSIEKRLLRLSKFGFTVKEIKKLKNYLHVFTNQIIRKFSETETSCNKDTELMIKNRKKILKEIQFSDNPIEMLKAAKKLLIDCKKFGTIQFSTMARLGFIASIILKSLVENKIISVSDQNLFLESIHSPVYSLRNDLYKFSKKQISKNSLMKKYGHLRPGTYDITAPRYDNNSSFMENLQFLKKSKNVRKFTEPNLSKIFSKHNMDITTSDFFSFAKKSIAGREFVKFEFTENLSDALELIAKAGNNLGFSRSEISNLDIKTIFSFDKYSIKEMRNLWSRKIKSQQQQKYLQNHLQHPSIIFSKNDFEIFSYFASQPNFITKKKITKNSIVLEKNMISDEISQKIVIIENADPGFDWIFTKNISGLITKYGGVASHMAIRCSELGIPAAIGCGDLLYDKLLFSEKLLLDCENKQILILQTKKKDEFFEEKKVLKSLGYIK